MKKILYLLAAFVFLTGLSGCSKMYNYGLIKDRSQDYMQSHNIAVMSVPADLDQPHFDTYYVVPVNSKPMREVRKAEDISVEKQN